jgi:hypothetical protein
VGALSKEIAYPLFDADNHYIEPEFADRTFRTEEPDGALLGIP